MLGKQHKACDGNHSWYRAAAVVTVMALGATPCLGVANTAWAETTSPNSSSLPAVTAAAAGATINGAMPVVITELAVNTGNGTPTVGGDAGEYIELTNMGTQPVAVSDLTLVYNNVDWTPSAFAASDAMIPAGGSIVLWDNFATVSGKSDSAVADPAAYFNAFWQNVTGVDPQLVLGSTLFTVEEGAGMANGSARTLVLSQTSTGYSNVVSYDNGGSEDHTLAYSYDTTGIATMTSDNTATPGTLIEGQKPESWPTGAQRELTVEDVSNAPANIKDSEGLALAVKATASDGQGNIAAVKLMLKTNLDADYVDSGIEGVVDAAGSTWSFTVPAGEFVGKTSAEYRFIITDVDGVTKTIDGANAIAITADDTKAQATVPLVITELAPNTANVNGADAYEFIEVTNVSNKDIDFSDSYTLYYNYPDKGDDSDVEWVPNESNIIIPAGKSAVFWIKNGSNDALTADDFNNAFDLTGNAALVAGANLFTIDSAGMSNSAARALKVTTKTRTLVSKASYTKDSNGSTSLQYMYAGNGNETQLVREDTPTPGSVIQDDMRVKAYEFPAVTEQPSIVDNTPPTFSNAEDLTISFDATANGTDVKRVTLYVKDSTESDYTAHNMVTANGSSTYSYTINKIDLMHKASVSYYVNVSDGITEPVQSEPKTVTATDCNADPLRFNIAEGKALRGKVDVHATGESSETLPELSIDGEKVNSGKTTSSLESEPYIAAEITQTDIFFFNSFTKKLVINGTPEESDWQENVIGTFDDGTYGDTATVSFPVALDMIDQADNTITLYMNAGTKSSATDILDQDGNINTENADNYLASNIRLILPDGRKLSVAKAEAGISPGASGAVTEERDVTAEIQDASSSIKMGDSAGQYEYLKLTFQIPNNAYTSSQYEWDTTQVADGAHTITATEGDNSRTINVTVDNTKPTITPSVTAKNTNGDIMRGDITINADAADVTSGINCEVSATLQNGSGDNADDAQAITLPYSTSSAQLPAGEHTLTFTATDDAGNTATQKVTFTTPQENPTDVTTSSTDGTATSDPVLTVNAKEESGDELNVKFYQGKSYSPSDADAIAISQGSTAQAGVADDAQAGEQISADDAAKLDKQDGDAVKVTSTDNGFPYQQFTINVPQDVVNDTSAITVVRWNGSAEPNADIYMYVKNVTTGAWDQVARIAADDKGDASVEQNVALADHVQDGVMRVVVQDGTGYAVTTDGTAATGSQQYADGGNTETMNGADGNAVITMSDDEISQNDADRSSYDFTFAWESDTQYYNANYDDDGYYQHQLDIHNWVLQHRDDMNIRYMFHTGDIVDNAEQSDQWTRADAAYTQLDEAGFPYGVLAGNHDVDHKTEDYTQYSQYFGEGRYNGNAWYGGSYKNNRAHYDLISAGGMDFIMMYVGWGIGDEEIAWMNQVLAQYSDRIAILNFHEYLLASGGLGLIPQEIYKRVVVPNANVKMVLSGHYHSAQKTISQIDSDGDGKADRNVVNMLFDYQGMEEGGLGYLRLMHVNAEEGTMRIRTYSPSRQQYGSEGVTTSAFVPSDEEFVINLKELGINTGSDSQRSLSTDSFGIDMLGGDEKSLIGETTAKVSGEPDENGLYNATASIEWKNAPTGTSGWYAVLSNNYGGVATSEVAQVVAVENDGGNDDGGSNDDGNDDGNNNADGGQSGDGSQHDANNADGATNGDGGVMASTGASIVAAFMAALFAGGCAIAMMSARKSGRFNHRG